MSAGGSATGGGPVRAPAWAAYGALAAAVLSAAAALVVATAESASMPILIAGYLAGALLTTVLAASYRSQRNARRANPRFRVQRTVDRAAAFGIGLGFAAGLANAFLLATELAK